MDTVHSTYISMAVGSGGELSHHEGHVDDAYKYSGQRVAMWLCCVVYVECG